MSLLFYNTVDVTNPPTLLPTNHLGDNFIQTDFQKKGKNEGTLRQRHICIESGDSSRRGDRFGISS